MSSVTSAPPEEHGQSPSSAAPAADPTCALRDALEARFRRVSELLYDTRVSSDVLDAEVMPFIADDVVFVDPWQTSKGRDRYRRGLAGFHDMFRFDLAITQVAVRLEPGGRRGRAMIDSVMNLRQLSWLYVYPLRTFLVYEFTLEGEGERAHPLIHKQEEMWSLADMIEAIPGVGAFYAEVFRNAFRVGFLAASAVAARGKSWR